MSGNISRRLIASKWSFIQLRSVRTLVNTLTKLWILHSVKNINHGNNSQWKIAWRISILFGFSHHSDQLMCFIISAKYLMSFFNGKTHNLQTQKYHVSMTSPEAKIVNFYNGGILVFFWIFLENFVEI